MTEGWMAEVVCKACSLNDFRVEAGSQRQLGLFAFQGFCQSPTKLGDLDRVGQSIMEWLHMVGTDDLTDPGQSAKCRRIQDAIPVPLESTALIALPVIMATLGAVQVRPRR